MHEAAVPQDGLRLDEFNAYLTDWLGESYDKTLAEGSYYKQNFLTVTIGGVECGLSGDTTRAAVTKYLIAYETSDPVFVVVANQKGVFNRVVLGHGGEPIPGFYLYTKEPQAGSTVLEEALEWPVAETRGGSAPPSHVLWSAPDLTSASASDLFVLQGQLLGELRSRGVLRTNNPPVGDYAEWLVSQALGSNRLPANSTKSFDLESRVYGKVQVKARLVSSPAKSGQLQTSPFRTDGFDYAALVLLSDIDFSVVSAVLLPLAAVQERWSWHQHVKGWTVQMNGPTMDHNDKIDISDGLRRAAAGLA
ncbi:hypothetical protein [Janibacter sp. DB-40]|uniref:hypothetical protein n=1 Tax=Janibacter sp. DB-40 TaxID=3028808 RepID=UPI00240583F5|nr:hypothetical protein [Janibacter sp. DB-40]